MDSFSSPQALSAERSSADANSSCAKTVECVRAAERLSPVFAPSKAKTGVCTAERRVQLHCWAATATSVRMGGLAPRYSSAIGTIAPAAASLASRVQTARPPPPSPSSPLAMCTQRHSIAARTPRSASPSASGQTDRWGLWCSTEWTSSSSAWSCLRDVCVSAA